MAAMMASSEGRVAALARHLGVQPSSSSSSTTTTTTTHR